MYQLINQNIAAVIASAQELDISLYTGLRASLSSVDVATDSEFQKRYRNYWRMNVGRFGPEFYARYFTHLSDCQRAGAVDLRKTIEVLSDGSLESRGLQFSFATKLVHMVDPKLPVYDSYVAAFYFFVPLPSNTARIRRIQHFFQVNDFLGREYRRVIRNGLLGESISEFRTQHALSSGVPDERIIDWLLWGWVSYLRTGAQYDNKALYN